MKFEHVESTGCPGSQTVLAECVQGNTVIAAHLWLCVICISMRVNIHQTLQRPITTCMVMKHQVAHTISLLSLEIAHSSSQILAGHCLQDKQPILDV